MNDVQPAALSGEDLARPSSCRCFQRDLSIKQLIVIWIFCFFALLAIIQILLVVLSTSSITITSFVVTIVVSALQAAVLTWLVLRVTRPLLLLERAMRKALEGDYASGALDGMQNELATREIQRVVEYQKRLADELVGLRAENRLVRESRMATKAKLREMEIRTEQEELIHVYAARAADALYAAASRSAGDLRPRAWPATSHVQGQGELRVDARGRREAPVSRFRPPRRPCGCSAARGTGQPAAERSVDLIQGTWTLSPWPAGGCVVDAGFSGRPAGAAVRQHSGRRNAAAAGDAHQGQPVDARRRRGCRVGEPGAEGSRSKAETDRLIRRIQAALGPAYYTVAQVSIAGTAPPDDDRGEARAAARTRACNCSHGAPPRRPRPQI